MIQTPKPQVDPPAGTSKRGASPASPTLSPAHKRRYPSQGQHISTPPEENTFKLNGQVRWQQQRAQWVQSQSPADDLASEPAALPVRRQPIGPDLTYEELLATNKVFDEPFRLQDMINFLVEAWTEEGLYD